MRWLLLSDIHFKHHDLDRIRQTAQWIISAAAHHKPARVIVCGDLLTSRTMQPTHVLSACYRFISHLSDIVPRIHIILGNHDLAYKRDYQTTALEALNFKRLAPHVSVHSVIAKHEWDGRRVLLLPFREEQEELTDAVDAIDAQEARETVAFAHLAINKAITQKFVPNGTNSVRYYGLTGPDRFASLARTFTGHFHSPQTIIQDGRQSDDLQGSLTYLGSPCQLNWGDLHDEQRGVVLLDPDTLEHGTLVNPHAVGYIAVDLEKVLTGEIGEETVKDKHVMLLGSPSHLKYVTARDQLLSLGVRSVRNWTHTNFAPNANRRPVESLGASVPASDAAIQPLEEPVESATDKGLVPATDGTAEATLDAPPEVERLDLLAEAREYVDLLELDEYLHPRREELVRVGQRMIQASRNMPDQDSEMEINYEDFLDRSAQALGTSSDSGLAGEFTNIFVAEPRRLTVTNFLGIQDTITIDFQRDVPRGLTLLVGDNGSGKSTLIEAVVWCQFGQCIRNGLAANDVLNDTVGKDCSVKLEFANGYAITRYRKHKVHKNRIVVSLHGEDQPHLEHPTSRTTQAAINELLGTDYDTYVRIVLLSQESAASFLNSTPIQRRELIESSLGLPILDHCGQMSKMLLKDIDTQVSEVEGKLEAVKRTMEYSEERLEELDKTRRRLESQAAKVVASLKAKAEEDQPERHEERTTASEEDEPESHEQETPAATEEAESGVATRDRIATLQKQIRAKKDTLRQLRSELDAMEAAIDAARPVGLRKFLLDIQAAISRFLRNLRSLFGFKDDLEETASQTQDETATIRQNIETSTSHIESLKRKEKAAINHALMMSEQAAQAMKAQKAREKAREDAQRAREEQQQIAQQAREDLRQQVAVKQRDAVIYKNLAETEESSLQSLKSEYKALRKQRHGIISDRELFNFWSSSLTKRTKRATKGKAATTNFREHILHKVISELNSLLAQVLTVLYDDTRHQHIATGMLRSLLEEPDVLDPTLAVSPSLAYGKRSSGERKRVDLALFFALLQLARAKSAHRAHYVLVDEVFDNLDNAGQAAVMRWLGVMSQTVVGWVIVITHSQFLIQREVEEKVVVVRAQMGGEGTELFVGDERMGKE
ncbi:uncharacterized protein FIESC28_10112 [Fusarium coffeatum]|uniref:Rad50/SbcC-type AAA domain-containing protein n=1 Tax=Fusarium coffeatum TaxID=231269 RepID=A0A366QW29_9HYPO|nr:uncharacterized protein FIESC28_10112 [Fusarium coffeatum]RBR08932.1 hypothetical protein FIESC28_10112 [Fusarium coffeatum]